METLLCLLPLTCLAALARLARRTARARAAPPTPPAHPSRAFTPGPRLRLVARAASGALLALALLTLALLPWPAAWPTTAALAAPVATAQALVRTHIDLVTILAVAIAITEPALAAMATRILRALRGLVHALITLPRCGLLLARLAWLTLRIAALRLRNWRQARRYRCLPPAAPQFAPAAPTSPPLRRRLPLHRRT